MQEQNLIRQIIQEGLDSGIGTNLDLANFPPFVKLLTWVGTAYILMYWSTSEHNSSSLFPSSITCVRQSGQSKPTYLVDLGCPFIICWCRLCVTMSLPGEGFRRGIHSRIPSLMPRHTFCSVSFPFWSCPFVLSLPLIWTELLDLCVDRRRRTLPLLQGGHFHLVCFAGSRAPSFLMEGHGGEKYRYS